MDVTVDLRDTKKTRKVFLAYAAAVACVLLAFALRAAIAPALGSKTPYVTFFPAVMLAAWLGGLWPGMLATLLSLLVAFHNFIKPIHNWTEANSEDIVGGLIFLVACSFISVLNEALRRSRARDHERLHQLLLEIEGRNRAENALVESRMQAELARDLLQTTLVSIGDAVITTDATGRVTFLNPVAQQLTGWSQRDAAGKPVSEVFHIIHETTRAVAEDPVEKALREGVAVQLANRTILVAKDGRDIPIEDSAAPIRDEKRGVLGVVLVFRDVTEFKRTQDELQSSNVQLTQANRELEEFAYVASHDLQEPLRMVNIYTQLILKKVGRQDAELARFGDFVQRGVKQMEMLIRDLLEYSRTGAAEEVPVGVADLSESLRESLSMLKSEIDENGAVVTSEALPVVRGETSQLTQVFQNLLSNAIKYHKKGSSPSIHISAQPDGGRWIISVRDNGIGFEQKHSERIFGLFKRLHKDEYEGTGLGLAICQRIIQKCGGRIWGEGRLGEGATFRFSLVGAEADAILDS